MNKQIGENQNLEKILFSDTSIAEKNLLIKSALICYGLRSNQYSNILAKQFNPQNRKRTGHVGINATLENLPLNLQMDYLYSNKGIYTELSPFEIIPTKKQNVTFSKWQLFFKNKILSELQLRETPSWYQKKTNNGIPMPELFLYEGDGNLMGSIPGICAYQGNDSLCLFCGFEGKEIGQIKPEDYGEVVCSALYENPNITITLTGGNSNKKDNGLKRYIPYILSIREKIQEITLNNSFPSIQLECSPSINVQDFDELIQLGVSSFSINLEIFNERLRKHYCKGKSKIPRSLYVDTWKYLVEKLGKFKLGSALIYGLEPENETLEGAIFLLEMGVQPNLIPFMPVPGSILENKTPPNFLDYYETCKKIAYEMYKVNVDVKQNLGCTTCNACTLESDIYKSILTREDSINHDKSNLFSLE